MLAGLLRIFFYDVDEDLCDFRLTSYPRYNFRAWIMEEDNHQKYLQFLPPPVDRLASNASGSLSNFDSNRHFLMAEGNGGCPAPVSVHQWIHCQSTSQKYVQFLAETGHPEVQKQTASYDVSERLPAFGVPSPSQLVNNPSCIMRTDDEVVLCGIKIPSAEPYLIYL